MGFCVSSGCHQEERLGTRINTKKGRRAAVILFKVCIHLRVSINTDCRFANQLRVLSMGLNYGAQI